MSTQLNAPVITAEVIDRTKIRVCGLDVENATGYQVKIGTLSGGQPIRQVAPVDGVVEFDRLLPRSVYYIQARALGDDETILSSEWTAEKQVVTGFVIDNELEVPNIGLATGSFVSLSVSGLTAKKEYRYQIATTAAGLETAVPKCMGSGDGSAIIGGLEPGTTYYVRFCLVEIDKCSVWSDVVSATTREVTNTIEVTSGNDSGEGTLRQAFSDATTGTKIVLKVATITLDTSLTNPSNKYLFIVGGLSERTVIQPGNSNQLSGSSYSCFRFVKFTGNSGSNQTITYSTLDDCVIDNVASTNTNCALRYVKIFNSVISYCSWYQGVNEGWVVDSQILNCSASASAGGGFNSVVINTLIRGCSAGTGGYGGAGRSGFYVGCTLANNSCGMYGGAVHSGTLISCNVESNTSAGNGGGLNSCTATNCYVHDNNGSGCSGCVLYDCYIYNNKGAGCEGGTTARNCDIYNNTSNGVNSSIAYDCHIHHNNSSGSASCTCVNCIIEYNTYSGQGAGANGGSCTDCIIRNNLSTGTKAGGGATKDVVLKNCIITGNNDLNTDYGTGCGGVVRGGEIHNCIITDNETYSYYGIGASFVGVIRDSLIIGNRNRYIGISNTQVYLLNKNGSYIANSTTGYINGYSFGTNGNVWNTLCTGMTPSPASASNNINYSGNASAYFVDPENGDYRLKPGCNAIEAGSNSYVNEGETDLAGNPRIAGTNVDVGAYEFEPVPLAVPSFSVTTGAGGQGTIAFTLPANSSAFLLQYADNADFTGAEEITTSSAGIALTGLSGTVYFRGKALGVSGISLDSDWTDTQSAFFDASAPIVAVDRSPIEMTVGDTVNLLDGVTVTDESEYTLHYQVMDRDNQPIEVGGVTTDIATSGIPVGNYMFVITATDTAGNVGTADRGLAVLPPRLAKPVISAQGVGKYSAEISGLVNANASGWKLKVDGTDRDVSPVGGKVTITGLDPSMPHTIQAQALGDWVQPLPTPGGPPPAPPSGSWRDSAWSNEVSVSLSGVAFFQWVAETVMSHDGRTFQNVELKAKIKDADTGELLPKAMVTGAEFTCWRLHADGTRTAVTGFDAVAVPNSAFSAAADDDGFNFIYVPDQTSTRMFAAAGRYVLVVAVQLASGNPFDIYSNELTVF